MRQNNVLWFFVGAHYWKPTLILIGIATLFFTLIGAIILISVYFPK